MLPWYPDFTDRFGIKGTALAWIESYLESTSVSGGQLKYCDQFFFVTAWYIKKICARKNGCWREISVRDECFIKTLFRMFCCCLLAVCCKGNFQKSLNVLWNVTCVVASRLLGGSNSQNKGKCWVMSRCALRVGGIWLSGEIVDGQMKNTSS